MKSIIIIHIYFGQLPSFFNLWLESCEQNKTINFLICTDQEIENSASNIKIIKSNLEKIKNRLEQITKFKVELDSARKLCDFRALYGQLFSDYTSQFDFWGFCDSDLIFGDIRSFITDEILETYDFILGMGHFQLHRTNDTKLIEATKLAHGRGSKPYWEPNFNPSNFKSDIGPDYETVLKSKDNFIFDELPYGVAAKYYELYPEKFWSGYSPEGRCFDDVDENSSYLSDAYNTYNKYINSSYHKLSYIFPFWKRIRTSCNECNAVIYQKCNNKIYRVGLGPKFQIQKKELLYVHFLHRKMKVKIKRTDKYLIIANRFIDYKKLTPFLLAIYNLRIEHFWNIYLNKIINRIKK